MWQVIYPRTYEDIRMFIPTYDFLRTDSFSQLHFVIFKLSGDMYYIFSKCP